MAGQTRRTFLQSGLAASATAALLEPVRALAQDVKPVRIKTIDVFDIEIPTPREQVERGYINHYSVARLETDAGARGYYVGYEAPSPETLAHEVRPALIGKDLFAVEDHLKAGLADWGGLEHALWDAIGKIAGQPVYRLLGGAKSSLRAYLTCVWKGKEDQSDVPFRDQVDMAVRIKNAGFKGMKIRAWRPNPMDDVEVCAEIRAAVGPEFAVMFDRTAHLPGKVWDYPTALKVARGLEKHHGTWLEEPFDRNDFFSPARLAREVEILITGGEGYQGLDPFRECLVQETYDILQPDGVGAGGIFTVRKIAALVEAFHKPVIMHGSMGLSLAGWLQSSAAFGAPWQELALITPPLLPEEQWSPALKVLNSKSVFTFREGEIQVPQGPGLGLNLNEEALERFRVA